MMSNYEVRNRYFLQCIMGQCQELVRHKNDDSQFSFTDFVVTFYIIFFGSRMYHENMPRLHFAKSKEKNMGIWHLSINLI